LKVLPQLLVPLLLWNTSWSYWTLASRAGRPDVESKTFVKRIFKKEFKKYVKQKNKKIKHYLKRDFEQFLPLPLFSTAPDPLGPG
jgi:hypothetical protein